MYYYLISHLNEWVFQYGGLALFFLLAFGIIGLPIPDETLIVIAGVLIAKGQLNPIVSFFSVFMGGAVGITTSYILGRTGEKFFIEKHGKRFGLTHKRIQWVHNWFEHIGVWSLFFGYFLPGIRHFTGIVAGISQLRFKLFACFAYTGALVWTITFLSLGYFFGTQWEGILEYVEESLLIILLIIAALVLAFYFYKKRKKHKFWNFFK